MQTLPQTTPPAQGNPQNAGNSEAAPDGAGGLFRFQMIADRGVMVAYMRLRGVRSDVATLVPVAEILGPYGFNPSVRTIGHPLGVHALAEICRLILSRQHLADPGLPPAKERIT